MLESTVLELLRSVVEEADDLPQQQLDIILARLLPAHTAESPAAARVVAELLRRTETVVQPYLQVGGPSRDGLGCCGPCYWMVVKQRVVPAGHLPVLAWQQLLREVLVADGSRSCAFLLLRPAPYRSCCRHCCWAAAPTASSRTTATRCSMR